MTVSEYFLRMLGKYESQLLCPPHLYLLFFGGSRMVSSSAGQVTGGPVVAVSGPGHPLLFSPLFLVHGLGPLEFTGADKFLALLSGWFCRAVGVTHGYLEYHGAWTASAVPFGRERECSPVFFSLFSFLSFTFSLFSICFFGLFLNTAPDWLPPSQGEGNSYIRGSK